MKIKVIATLLASAVLSIVAPATAQPFDPNYPALDEKQQGALRNLVDLARQPMGNWSDMDRAKRSAFDDYQYQLAFMTYALAVAQSQMVPAYRELIKQATDSNIVKMVSNDVWEPKWIRIVSDPHYNKYLRPVKDWRDPVADKNIMYSGHLLQMIGLYEVLYDDHKWDRPDSMVYALIRLLSGSKKTVPAISA